MNFLAQNGHYGSDLEDEDMRQRIERVQEDLKDLENFYDIPISPLRIARLMKFYEQELTALRTTDFESYDQQSKVDYLLLQNYLNKGLRQLELDVEKDDKTEAVLPFASIIIHLCEDRQQVKQMDAERAGKDVYELGKQISAIKIEILNGKIKLQKTIALRAANTVDQLHSHLVGWFNFYRGYDPIFTLWVSEPYGKVEKSCRLSLQLFEKSWWA